MSLNFYQPRKPIFLKWIFVLFCAFSFSCSNEIDINADWKETIVIYGLLNPTQREQYVKVAKAFLNENTNALKVAKISDSLYLDTASVKLRRIDNNKIYILKRVWDISKQPGLFANDINPLYKFEPIGNDTIAPNVEYEIEVLNPKTGNRAFAKTITCAHTTSTSPFRPSSTVFSFQPEFIVVDFWAAVNSVAYAFQFHVTYDEFEKDDTNTKNRKTISWQFEPNYAVTERTNYTLSYPRDNLLSFMVNTMKVSPTTFHRLISVGFTATAVNRDFRDYLAVNEPSIGIVQKQADYTNITNGVGLFGGRTTLEYKNIAIESASINLLRFLAISKPLNIVL